MQPTRSKDPRVHITRRSGNPAHASLENWKNSFGAASSPTTSHNPLTFKTSATVSTRKTLALPSPCDVRQPGLINSKCLPIKESRVMQDAFWGV
jgi:hypothetical protein